jgi:hypothetical protein
VTKVHWPLWVTDEEGRRTGEVLPGRPLAEGDLREAVIRDGPDSQQGVPTSGNAWSRELLAKLLPAPEPEYRQGADGYLLTLAPLYGLTRRVEQPQGCYRVHGRNQYWCGATDERAERSLVRYERRSRTLSGHLRAAGVDPTRRPGGAQRLLPVAVPAAAGDAAAGRSSPPGRPSSGGREPVGAGAAQRPPVVPFTEKDGRYWGPPAGDTAAVEGLNGCGGRGRLHGVRLAGVLVARPPPAPPAPVANFRRALENEDVVVFDIRTQESILNSPLAPASGEGRSEGLKLWKPLTPTLSPEAGERGFRG